MRISRVLHTTPLRKVSSSKLLRTWLAEQVGVFVSHLLLELRSGFRRLLVGSKDLHQGHCLSTKVFFLPIQDLYGLFLLR